MNNLLIRVDGNSKIGMGHFFRCISLAGYLKDDFKIIFAIQNPSAEMEKIIFNQGYSLKKLPTQNKNLLEAEVLKQYLSKDIDLVLDGYNFDYQYQKAIKPFCKRLFYIDDLNEGKSCADYVINHSLSALEEDYPKIPGVKYLLGYDYILLREEFLFTQTNKVPREKVENITVCMGGADKDNNTLKIAEAILAINLELKLNLIFGSANENLEKCKSFLPQTSFLEYLINLDGKSMSRVIKDSDLVIAPASGIAHETISLGVPLITGIIATNQEKIAPFIGKKNLGVNLGWINKITSDSLQYTILKLINDFKTRELMVRNQISSIDRKSPERLKRIFIC